MTNAELLEVLKKLDGFSTDTELANFYGVDKRVISNFRQRVGGNDINKLIIEDLLDKLQKSERKLVRLERGPKKK